MKSFKTCKYVIEKQPFITLNFLKTIALLYDVKLINVEMTLRDKDGKFN